MRVLSIVQSYFPFQDRGGPVFKVRSIARGLAERGHRVTILTADLGLSRLQGRDNVEYVRCKWGWRMREGNVETIYLSTSARYRALTINPGVIGFSRAFLSEFDVAHVFGLYDLLGPIVSHFCRRQSLPYVIEPMGMHRPIVRNLVLKRLYHQLLGTRMVAGAQFIVATSEQEQQVLRDSEIDTARIVIRRNGIDRPGRLPLAGEFRRKWKIAADAKVILFLGRLVSKKSPDLLLQAFARVRGKGPQFEGTLLVLAGPQESDGFLPTLKTMAQSLGVGQHTMFVGPLYDDEKWQAYRDADVFVLPSQNENFGNSAAESAVCGTPVIVTDQCGVASYVGNAGLVIRHDLVELENALVRILGDAEFRRACGDGCVQLGDTFSWGQPLDQTEELYGRCVSQRSLQEATA